MQKYKFENMAGITQHWLELACELDKKKTRQEVEDTKNYLASTTQV